MRELCPPPRSCEPPCPEPTPPQLPAPPLARSGPIRSARRSPPPTHWRRPLPRRCLHGDAGTGSARWPPSRAAGAPGPPAAAVHRSPPWPPGSCCSCCCLPPPPPPPPATTAYPAPTRWGGRGSSGGCEGCWGQRLPCWPFPLVDSCRAGPGRSGLAAAAVGAEDGGRARSVPVLLRAGSGRAVRKGLAWSGAAGEEEPGCCVRVLSLIQRLSLPARLSIKFL